MGQSARSFTRVSGCAATLWRLLSDSEEMTREAATANAEEEAVMEGGHAVDASREMATALSE